LPSVDGARDKAARALAELTRDLFHGAVRRQFAIDLRDDEGRPLLQVTVTYEVEQAR
jgi:hypothetical protein